MGSKTWDVARRPLASMVLGAAALLLVACGEDSPKGTVEEGGIHVPDSFRDLAEKAQEHVYSMEYQVVGPNGEIQESGTLYRKPPKFRIDRVFGAEDMSVSSTTIWLQDEVVECSRPQGSEWQCVTGPSVGPVDGLPVVIKSPQGFSITEGDGRTLAGQEVACFLAVPTGETVPPFPEEFEVCLNADGALLFQMSKSSSSDVEGGAAGSYLATIREAITYSTEVDESDFDPPAEALGLP